MDPYLGPCPFCGTTAVKMACEYCDTPRSMTYYANCVKCMAVGPSALDKTEAATRWNIAIRAAEAEENSYWPTWLVIGLIVLALGAICYINRQWFGVVPDKLDR
jgi:hypothetical protein